jgi:hypothetical protein
VRRGELGEKERVSRGLEERVAGRGREQGEKRSRGRARFTGTNVVKPRHLGAA